MYNIKIIGAGYVGLAHACLFAKNNHNLQVDVIEVDEDKLNNLKNGLSPLKEKAIKEFIESKPENLFYSKSLKIDDNTKAIFVAVPTSWDNIKQSLNTDILTNVLDAIDRHDIPIVIKSTIPIMYTEDYIKKTNKNNVIFSPEFLREGQALHDLEYPSRIVIGTNQNYLFEKIKELYLTVTKNNVEILQLTPTEAESCKLFANTYLAMRVAFFNELDSIAQTYNLNSESIINAISLDDRIGSLYNNPSFGYGGYCLPKDTKQLSELANSEYSSIISAITRSNNKRKQFIVSEVLKTDVKTVGIENFAMKADSDNDRESSLFEIAKELENNGINIIVYNYDNSNYKNYLDWDKFIQDSDLILANRMTERLLEVKEKVYTRDITHKD